MDAKEELLEILDYIKYKVKNDLCLMEEAESVSKLLKEHMHLDGTIEDLAKFYGVSEGNVRSTINRKMIEKPRRRVYYRFQSFLKVAPERWRNSRIVNKEDKL